MSKFAGIIFIIIGVVLFFACLIMFFVSIIKTDDLCEMNDKIHTIENTIQEEYFSQTEKSEAELIVIKDKIDNLKLIKKYMEKDCIRTIVFFIVLIINFIIFFNLSFSTWHGKYSEKIKIHEQDNITLEEEILLNIRPEIDTEETNGK